MKNYAHITDVKSRAILMGLDHLRHLEGLSSFTLTPDTRDAVSEAISQTKSDLVKLIYYSDN